MVVQAIKTVNGTPFIYHYSDLGLYIERDGIKYADAIDLPQFDYTYTETDEPLEPGTYQDVMAFINND